MADQVYKSFALQFLPKGENTVDKIKIVHAWASTGDLEDQVIYDGIRQDILKNYGEGKVTIVELTPSKTFTISAE